MPEWLTILLSILGTTGISTGVMGFLFWKLERKAQKREERQTEHDKARLESEKLNIDLFSATMQLAEATAKAVQRIPEAHANGEITSALSYAAEVKHKQKDFLNRQAVNHIYTE